VRKKNDLAGKTEDKGRVVDDLAVSELGEN
jgi:hypothetical protein